MSTTSFSFTASSVKRSGSWRSAISPFRFLSCYGGYSRLWLLVHCSPGVHQPPPEFHLSGFFPFPFRPGSPRHLSLSLAMSRGLRPCSGVLCHLRVQWLFLPFRCAIFVCTHRDRWHLRSECGGVFFLVLGGRSFPPTTLPNPVCHISFLPTPPCWPQLLYACANPSCTMTDLNVGVFLKDVGI